MRIPFYIFFLVIFLSAASSFNINAQSVSYNQFWNGLNFTHPFKEKWATELNTGSTFSSSATSKNLFEDYAQFNIRGWIHNYYKARWKFSFYTHYFYNKLITDVQPASIEWRLAPQATYYIRKRDFTLTTRMRIEMRYINQDHQGFKDYYRYRQQVKYLQPFNSKIILQDVWYGIASDELFFKLPNANNQFSFDRNRLTLGLGYSVTNNFQIELAYVNEFLPRSTNEIYNAISFSLNFNNFLSNFKENVEIIKQDFKSDE